MERVIECAGRIAQAVALIATIALVALLFVPQDARAQAIPTVPNSISYGTRQLSVTPGTISTVAGSGGSRTWAANMTTGAVTVTDGFTARVAANDVPMTVKRTIPWAKVLTGAAKALPWVAAGSLLYEFWNQYHCKAIPGNVGQIGCAEGLPANVVSCNGWGGTGPGVIPFTCSAASWCSQRAAIVNNLSPAQGGPSASLKPLAGVLSGSGASLACIFQANNGSTFGAEDMGVGTPGTALECTGGYGVGKGAFVTDPRCFKSDATDPLTVTEFDAPRPGMVDVPAAPYAPDELAKEAVKDGRVDYNPLADPYSIHGPDAVTGPVSTTTNPDGTTKTTAPEYDFDYPPTGSPVTWDEEVVTTTPDGTTTTTNPDKLELCGGPGQPICNVKVDETGTLTSGSTTAAEAALTTTKDAITTKITDSTNRTELPITWTWLPPVGSCTPFDFNTGRMGAFAIDPCTNPNVAIWRELLAWFLASLTLWYIWSSAINLRNGSS